LKDCSQEFNEDELTFSWVDAKCHPELLEAFNISEVFVPTLLAYSPVKRKFTFLKEEFKDENIKEFLYNVRKQKMLKIEENL
jgi:hypothetical protein